MPGWTTAGLEGLRHRLHPGVPLQSPHRPGHPAAPGGGGPARAEEQVVEGEERRGAVRHQGQGNERQRQRADPGQCRRGLRCIDSGDGRGLRHLCDGVHLEGLQPGEEVQGEAEVAGGESSVQHQLQLV